MLTNLVGSLRMLYVSEGGYSNDAHDPGGPTKLGVIQREYDAYRRKKGLPGRSVRFIESSEVEDIYKHQYWDQVDADDMPSGIDYMVFDDAVNTGPVQAARNVQRTLCSLGRKVAVDGVIGLNTMDALKRVDASTFINRYAETRMGFYRQIPGWRYFGYGWTHRIYGQPGDPGVLKNALSLAKRGVQNG